MLFNGYLNCALSVLSNLFIQIVEKYITHLKNNGIYSKIEALNFTAFFRL